MDDRLPPTNVEAEEALLGSLLIDPSVIFDTQLICKPDDFYREVNKFVYEAILRLDERQQPVDYLTITDDLRRHDRLDLVGGEAYVTGLFNRVPTSQNAESYANMVSTTALRRNMLTAASTIARLAYAEDEEIPDLLDQADKLLYGLRQNNGKTETQSAKDLTREYIEQVEKMSAIGGTLFGIPTGFLDLDKLTAGLPTGDLICIAARPSMGKTSLAVNMATHSTSLNKRVLFFSLEMEGIRVIERILAQDLRINSQRLRRGDLDKKTEMPGFYHMAGQLAETNLYVDDTPGITIEQVRSKARRMHAKHGLDIIFLDYLQLMGFSGKSNGRVHELSVITQGLKNLARELRIPIVFLSQLNRGVEARQDKRPQISDTRDSGTIEQDSDVMLLIYRDEYYNPDSTERPNIAELNVGKNRNGPTGIVDLYWNGDLTMFRNLQRQEVHLPRPSTNGKNGATKVIDDLGEVML